MSEHPLISLTTDFGLSDEYVGVVKATILALTPAATIVDICHTIAPQDIRAASFIFSRAFPSFPEKCIHLLIVDPGVGTKRNILIAKIKDSLCIAPDNGILSPLFRSFQKEIVVFQLTKPPSIQRTVSTTFHGRDILAPVAALLAQKAEPSEYGEQIRPSDCHLLPHPLLTFKENMLIGEVIHIDRFGNLCTSICRHDLERAQGIEQIDGIEINGHRIGKILPTYQAARHHQLLAVFDSHDHLEIARCNSSAQKLLKAKRGDLVTVVFSKK